MNSIATEKKRHAYHEDAQKWWNGLCSTTGEQIEIFNATEPVPKQLDFVDDPDEKKPNTFSIRQKERAELCVQVIFETNTDTPDQYAVDILDPDGNVRSLRLIAAEGGSDIVAEENSKRFTLGEVAWLILSPLM